MPLVVQQDVVGLQVPVHDVVGVQVFESQQDLCDVVLDDVLVQGLGIRGALSNLVELHDFGEVASDHVLLHEAQVLLVLERIVCFHDVVSC